MKRIVNVITYNAYKAISIIILMIPVLYIINHDANCIHLEVYKINSDHLLYSAFCKILSIFTIFLAALLGYNSMRFAETEAEEKKMRTAISLVLTASSGMLAVDLTTLGNKVKFDDELLLVAIRNNHFVIDLSIHIFGMLLSCVSCLALLNKDFRDYFFSDYDINQPLDQVRYASAHGGESKGVVGRSNIGPTIVRELYDKKITAEHAAKKRREEADKK